MYHYATGGMLGAESMELLRDVNTWLAVSETCITRGLYRIIKVGLLIRLGSSAENLFKSLQPFYLFPTTTV